MKIANDGRNGMRRGTRNICHEYRMRGICPKKNVQEFGRADFISYNCLNSFIACEALERFFQSRKKCELFTSEFDCPHKTWHGISMAQKQLGWSFNTSADFTANVWAVRSIWSSIVVLWCGCEWEIFVTRRQALCERPNDNSLCQSQHENDDLLKMLTFFLFITFNLCLSNAVVPA